MGLISNLKISQDEKKLLKKVYWRSLTQSAEMNFIKMQGIGYGFASIPMLRSFYKDDNDEYYAALSRSSTFFNTYPGFVPFILGVTLSMEKENSIEPIPNMDETINGIKVGLMGPLAGLGDSFFMETLRVIVTGIALSLASQGNFLGPLLFFLLFHIPFFAVRYYGTFIGYSLGANYIKTATESGLINAITKGATLLGLVMVGAMTFLNVPFILDFKTSISGQEFVLQDILDKILKGLLPLSLVLASTFLLRKGKSPNFVMVLIIVLSAILAVLGVMK
ncbi:PTS system mannose/fructose/sorbose family transporter subunit IID [Enterococcus sp. OL5]|uniref:PTS system mannose/fructose/sorbose family transporter subunit IID n=1 Tax=Enterococcus sp. OL5 TaxID=2590214 RepID=UPI00112E0309|nr:PTS system mannose/fructose/sorbose family transporter subunit IID [Enterococcus sp. OL5]TPR56884.1 PTS system mannose/fructose/sorbose family transporter subunit IID [Enterococcus sp. OL5]